MPLELDIPARDEVSRLNAKDEHSSGCRYTFWCRQPERAQLVLNGPLVLGDDIGVHGCANIRTRKEVKIEMP